jgi:pimeloyl-ACP methyl ester carboxylesterase
MPAGPFSHAADVLAVLDDAGIDRAALVGASYGGMVCLDLTASHPHRVAGLVLADAALPEHEWSPAVRAFGAAEDEALEAGDLDRAAEVNVEFWVPDAPERVRAAIHEQQRNAFALQVGKADEEELLTDELTSALAAIDVPALVLVGEDDHADFHAIADRLTDALPQARRATIPGAGHLPSLEQPEAFDDAVLPFLATLR